MATTRIKDALPEQANGTTTLAEAAEISVQEVKEEATQAGTRLVGWLRQLPLASLGLLAVIGDETKVFVNKLFMTKLVARGEAVQHDAAQWMKDVQARLR